MSIISQAFSSFQRVPFFYFLCHGAYINRDKFTILPWINRSSFCEKKMIKKRFLSIIFSEKLTLKEKYPFLLHRMPKNKLWGPFLPEYKHILALLREQLWQSMSGIAHKKIGDSKPPWTLGRDLQRWQEKAWKCLCRNQSWESCVQCTTLIFWYNQDKWWV